MRRVDPVVVDQLRKIREIIAALNELTDNGQSVADIINQTTYIIANPDPALPSALTLVEGPGIDITLGPGTATIALEPVIAAPTTSVGMDSVMLMMGA